MDNSDDKRGRSLPVAIVTVVVAGLAGLLDDVLLGLDWILAFAMSTDEIWFGLATALSRGARYLPSVPDRAGTYLFLAALAVFALIAVYRLSSIAADRL